MTSAEKSKRSGTEKKEEEEEEEDIFFDAESEPAVSISTKTEESGRFDSSADLFD